MPAHTADVRRRRERRATDRRGRASDACRLLAHGRRSHRRAAVFQVREPAARRRLQVPRRLQRVVAAVGRRASPRRRHLLVRQPRAGDRARRSGARHPARHRHAVGRACREAHRHGRLRRRSGAVRSRPRGPRGHRPPARARARPHADPALRPPAHHRRPGHGRPRADRRSRRARLSLRALRRRRTAVWIGDRREGARAGLHR